MIGTNRWCAGCRYDEVVKDVVSSITSIAELSSSAESLDLRSGQPATGPSAGGVANGPIHEE